MNILRHAWYALTSAYDRDGNLKILNKRQPDRHALHIEGVNQDVVDTVLAIICGSLDIPDAQQYCLRPTDDLGELYRMMHPWYLVDEMEYERLYLEVERVTGRVVNRDTFTEINITVEQVIRYVARDLQRAYVNENDA